MFCLPVACFIVLSTVASLVTSNDDVSLDSLNVLVQQQAATINSLQATVSALQAQQAQFTTNLAGLTANLAGVTANLAGVTGRVNTRVSFTAHMSHAPVTLTDSPFLFDGVVSNYGNGYNGQSGVFIAPVSGDYVFYAQVLNDPSTDRVDFAIFKGSLPLCYNHLTDHVTFYNTASCFAPVHLQHGDTVFVKRINTGTTIEGNVWTSFSGQLISADP